MDDGSPMLFTPLSIRGVTIRNRTMLSAMNQHAAKDGFADDGLLVHLGKFALGGFGVVTTEATAILPEARIAPGDLGIWSDAHIAPLKRVADFVRRAGAAASIQLGHSGRKGSARRPWAGGPLGEEDARNGEPPWPLVSATSEPLAPGHAVPQALQGDGIAHVLEGFASAAARADAAGFDIVEIHGGHGYLIASFLSPVINTRNDTYGGDLSGRMRFALEVAGAVRSRWPAHKPLFFRISSIDGHPQGWKIEDSVVLARELKARGVDLIDCSSGGLRGVAAIESARRHPGYQVPYARAIRHGADIPTAAVGLILSARQAEDILVRGDADLIALARQALYDPYWPRHAAQQLGLDQNFESWPQNSGWWLAHRAQGFKDIGYAPSGVPGGDVSG